MSEAKYVHFNADGTYKVYPSNDQLKMSSAPNSAFQSAVRIERWEDGKCQVIKDRDTGISPEDQYRKRKKYDLREPWVDVHVSKPTPGYCVVLFLGEGIEPVMAEWVEDGESHFKSEDGAKCDPIAWAYPLVPPLPKPLAPLNDRLFQLLADELATGDAQLMVNRIMTEVEK